MCRMACSARILRMSCPMFGVPFAGWLCQTYNHRTLAPWNGDVATMPSLTTESCCAVPRPPCATYHELSGVILGANLKRSSSKKLSQESVMRSFDRRSTSVHTESLVLPFDNTIDPIERQCVIFGQNENLSTRCLKRASAFSQKQCSLETCL